MTRDSSGTFYGFVTDGMRYWETPVTGSGYVVSDLDCQYSDFPLDAGGTCLTWELRPANPQVAVGGQTSQRAVHVLYTLNGFSGGGNPPAYRFGTKRGAAWTFEDLPMTGQLAADSTGVAWLSSNGELYRHTAPNRWDRATQPCGVHTTSIAFDESGVLYAGSDKNQIWRRDLAGVWSMETTPGVVGALRTGAGTVQYYRLEPTVDGGAGVALVYGRRIGNGWSEQIAFVSPDAPKWWDVDMALDSCGAPHFAVSIQQSNYTWPLQYIRWTGVGWRSTLVYTSQDPQGAALGVSTKTANLIYFASSPDVRYDTIPLK